jgi:pyruvate carboxylase
LAIDAIISIAK